MVHKLSEQEITEIVRLQVKKVVNMLCSQGYTLNVTDRAIGLLAREGYDPDFGARPVKRAIQHLMLNELSKRLLSGSVSMEHPINVDAADNTLVFSNAE